MAVVIEGESRQMDNCSELGLLSLGFMCQPQASAGDDRVGFKDQDYTVLYMSIIFLKSFLGYISRDSGSVGWVRPTDLHF